MKYGLNHKSKVNFRVLALTFLMILSLSIQTISATEIDLGTFKQGDGLTLLQSCSSCQSNNLTSVYSPNTTLILAHQTMTKDGSHYYYFCTNCTKDTGNYIVNGIGDLEGVPTIWSYTYTVTSTGSESNNEILIWCLIALAGLFILMTFIFNKEQWIIKTSLWIFALFSMLLAISAARAISGSSNPLIVYGDNAFYLVIVGIMFMLLYLFIYVTIMLFKSLRKGGVDL